MSRSLSVFVAVGIALGLLAGPALAASSPAVVTGGTNSVGDSSAVLLGAVNPNGSATTYYFQWGLTNAYGSTGNPHNAGSGTKSVAVQATAGSLTPGTVYHYRVIATNQFGLSAGADRTFKTGGHPPAGVATGVATDIGPFSAALTGTVNPNGEATTWLFQYGVTALYGSQTFGQTLAASSPPATVIQPLFGLAPGTTFHFRLVALHGLAVISYGADQTFMTEPYPRPFPFVRALTTPHTDRSRPYSFTTFGTVFGQFSPSLQCTGNVEVSYWRGRRELTNIVTAVQPNCTFSAQAAFGRLPGRGGPHRRVVLRVLIHFDGNGYLAPKFAHAESVVLG
jgi:hypothetical protein